jgi:hypothetical protein
MSGYIGTQPVPQATQTRDSFTATSGQTSFATGGYTPNFLDVYLNGVKLSAADYTASNGSDVVLASGAATGDILEVVAFTTFTPASIPVGTPSIDDNGNATAITIDSNEGVNIGKTSAALGTVGLQLSSTGYSAITTNHNTDTEAPLRLNKLNGEGSLLRLYKDSSEVGSIGVQSTDQLYIATPDGSGVGLIFDGDNRKIDPTDGAGSNLDNAVDLGTGAYRFKDAYLSGGIHLGGVGSANKLEDYEEGTFTPTFVGGFSTTSGGTLTSSNYAQRHGFYTKVGNTVTIYYALQLASPTNTTSGQVQIGNLPFATSTSGAVYQAASGYTATSSGAGADDTFFITFPNSTSMGMYWQFASGVQGRTGSNVGNSFYTSGTVTYFTPA